MEKEPNENRTKIENRTKFEKEIHFKLIPKSRPNLETNKYWNQIQNGK